MLIRKATQNDIDAVEKLYDAIHTAEENGKQTIGWIRGVYPVRATAENALQRGDLFVLEDDGEIYGTGIINKTQVESYKQGKWKYDVTDDQVCVLHTLVISPDSAGKGYGRAFLAYYEKYAEENGCLDLRIDTNARNAVARSMYQKHGYTEIGIVPTEFNGIAGVNLVLLEKYLGKENTNINPLEIMKRPAAYASGYENTPTKEQNRAKQLCWEYNRTAPNEQDKRRSILQELLGTCSPMTGIEPDFHCDYGFNIHTHGLVVINYNCVILDTSPVNIGAGAFIAPGVCLACSGHAIDPKQRSQGIGTSAPITLEENVWIGANATVCGGVTIGTGSVIGAGSVVTHDIPAGVIAAGVPCKVIRPITEKDKIAPAEILF